MREPGIIYRLTVPDQSVVYYGLLDGEIVDECIFDLTTDEGRLDAKAMDEVLEQRAAVIRARALLRPEPSGDRAEMRA